MSQLDLFGPVEVPALWLCWSCHYSWTSPDRPDVCLFCHEDTVGPASSALCAPRQEVDETKPVRLVPLKKWRCSLCWARLPRPVAERAPRCKTCREGQEHLFGREAGIPKNAKPLVPRKRRKTRAAT